MRLRARAKITGPKAFASFTLSPPESDAQVGLPVSDPPPAEEARGRDGHSLCARKPRRETSDLRRYSKKASIGIKAISAKTEAEKDEEEAEVKLSKIPQPMSAPRRNRDCGGNRR